MSGPHDWQPPAAVRDALADVFTDDETATFRFDGFADAGEAEAELRSFALRLRTIADQLDDVADLIS